MENTNLKVILHDEKNVLEKVEDLYITVQDQKLCVIASKVVADGDLDLFTVEGFENVYDAIQFARNYAKKFDIPRNRINADVSDLPSEIPRPLVDGMNPYNLLEDRDDLQDAIMDCMIEVEDDRAGHLDASLRVMKIFDAYLQKHHGVQL